MIRIATESGATTLRTTFCRQCRAKILVGLSDERMAVLVEVDPYAIGPQGEALAQLAGRATYALHRHGMGYRLTTRDHWQLTGGPHPLFDVVAEHVCDADEIPIIESVQRSRRHK